MSDPAKSQTTIGSVVFGPRWDKPTAVGLGDGQTIIPQPVYLHDMAKLLEMIADLQARMARLEEQHGR